MKTAKLFQNGRSQAVRLPKECRLPGDSVYVRKLAGRVILIPKDDPWRSMIEACGQVSEDFMETRDQGVQDEREPLT